MPDDSLNFLEFIQSFRRGELLSEGDDKLKELIAAIRMTGTKGSMTIELPFAINKAGQLECQPAVKIKKPVRSMGTGIYYMTDDGELTRRDPNQLDMMDQFEARRSGHDH